MLSEEDLIKEGECCGLRCRLCPYDPKYTKGTTKLRSKKSPTNCEASNLKSS